MDIQTQPETKEGIAMNDQHFEQSIHRICKNDKEGLREIYEDYCPMIYSVVLDILKNREDAEDITSDFFIRLWDIAGSYKKGNGHRAWLITIARNMAIDHLRKRMREQPTAEIPDYLHQAPSPEDSVIKSVSLEHALKTLKDEERQIIDLKIMGELTFKEIALLLKKPQGTVAWLYRNAVGKLKRCSYEQ